LSLPRDESSPLTRNKTRRFIKRKLEDDFACEQRAQRRPSALPGG
jgi:hypothetical protein